MAYTAAGDGSDWESSFSQILNRTKHNLNRINSRYAPGSTAASLDTGVLAQSRGVINNENVNQNALLLDRFNKTDTFLQRPEQTRSSTAVPTTDPNILERLIRIEEQHRAAESASTSRLLRLENTVEMALSRTEKYSQQMKDLEQNVMQLNSKLSTLNGFMELLQGENEAKRSAVAKMDHWIRQGEIWREDLDAKVETMTKLTKSLDRTRTEQRELMADHATRYELEQLRDKMTVVTQQSVAASLSAWHDKMEQSVRNVERQIALLRIGMTDGGRGTLGGDALLSQDEVAAALANPLPSELLLKGTVAHEVLQMQSQLEDKLESRLQLFLKDKVDGSHNALNQGLRQQLHRLCAEMGLDYPEIELGLQFPSAGEGAGVDMTGAKARESYRIRLLEARKKSDEEIQELNRAMNRVSTEIAALQQNAAVDQKHSAAVVVNLERKVEECIAVCGNSVNTVASRSARLEDLVRDTELAIRSSVTATKSELIERLADMAREWSTDRAGLDRRLMVNERIGEDCLDRIKLSQSAVESYFKASPEVKRFQRSAELVAQLQLQLSAVQEEARSTSSAVMKLEANASTKNEHLELRERVGRLEPTVLEKLPDYMESTKRVVDLSVVTQSRLDKLDALSTLHHNDIASTVSKLSAVDVLATQLKGLTSVATEEVRRLTTSVAELDAVTRKDINYLRDLTGSISSRVVAVEGKVSVMNKTYAADTVSTNNALAKLSTICEELQAHDATTQNTLVQLQWALEAEHRETTDQFALLKGRLDLMHHVQQQPAAPAESSGDNNQSIQIKFTTAADSSGEADSFDGHVTTTYTSSAAPVSQAAPPSSRAHTFSEASYTYAQQSSFSVSEANPTPVPAASSSAAAGVPPVPPAAKPVVRGGGGGYGAFLTEPLASPDTSANASSSFARAPMASTQSSLDRSADTSLAASQARKPAVPADQSQQSVQSSAQGSFVPAQNYSYEQQQQASPADDEFSEFDEGEPHSHHSDRFSQTSEEGDGMNGPVSMNEPENSWDDTHGGSAGAAEGPADGADENEMSASRIPQQSAFDMSMPSYVSHINSSSDANQSAFDYSYQKTSGHAASDEGSLGSQKLSVGSDDSVDQLNSTVAELVRHRDVILGAAEGGSGPASPVVRAPALASATSVTYDAALAEADAGSSSEEESGEESGEEESFDEQASQNSEDGVDEHGEQDEERSEEETEDIMSKSEATSAGGSYSQIDAMMAAEAQTGAGNTSSVVENSWDQTHQQSSFSTALGGSPPPSSKDTSGSSLSTSSSSASSRVAKRPGFAIPALNMASLPLRAPDVDEVPSHRSTGRSFAQQLAMSSSRQNTSDWDAESSLATARTPQKAEPALASVQPVSEERDTSNVSGLGDLSTLNVSVVDAPVVPDSRVIGSSGAEQSPTRSDLNDESTGGSVSDTSVSSASNYTVSSSSYLTISSASPQKPTVAPPAVATAARATSAAAPAASRLNLSTASRAESIKERLKNRLNKNRTSDTASVASSAAADEVMSFEDLDSQA